MLTGRAFLVDDHEIVLVMLHRLLGDLGVEVAGAMQSGVEAIPRILAAAPDLVILDLSMSDKNGFELVEELRTKGARCRYLVFTGAINNHVLDRLNQMRPDGTVSKLSRVAELTEAIKTVLDGRSYCCSLLRAKRSQYMKSANCATNLLTKREVEVLSLIGEAQTDEEISMSLGLAPSTVQGVRRNLLHKLELQNTPHLVRFARESGYTEFAHRRIPLQR